jgi:hypothetical protein
MALPFALAAGDHYLVSDPVESWHADFSDTNPPSVVLTASVLAGPQPPISPNQGGMATTLAVQMDAQVAMQLYKRLGELGRSMGWLR